MGSFTHTHDQTHPTMAMHAVDLHRQTDMTHLPFHVWMANAEAVVYGQVCLAQLLDTPRSSGPKLAFFVIVR